MKPVVLDCSVAISWCFEDEANEFSDQVLAYLIKHGALVPRLWALELCNVLLSAERAKRITIDGLSRFLDRVTRLPIRVADMSASECFRDVSRLGYDHKLTSYDACYLYLAKRERAPLATLDRALNAARKKLKISSGV